MFRLHDKSQIDFSCRLLPPPPPVRSRAIEQIILTLSAKDEQLLRIPILHPRITASCRNTIELKGSIQATDLKPGQIYTDWKLVLVGKGKYQQRYPLLGLPFLARGMAGPILPELRKEETATLYSRWMNSDRPLLLVSGPGGIGKTHLCESIVYQAVAQGFRAAEVSLSSEYDPTFIIDFAWCAFGSRLRHLFEGREDVADIFIKTQLTGSEQVFSQSELSVLVKAVANGTLESAQTETLLGNLARIIVLKNKPVLFYIRDLHKATDTVRNSLRHVIKGFESAGWGQVRIILEQRVSQRDTPQNSEQNKLRTEPDLWLWLKHFFRKKSYSYEEMKPVPLNIISASLQSIFNCDGVKKAVHLLAKKSQGNLQELSFMLQRLHDDGTIVDKLFHGVDQEQLQYIVPSLSKFRCRLAAMSTDECSSTLLRISEMHENLLATGKTQGCFWLGLMSILDMEVDAKLLASLLHLDEAAEVEPLLDFFVCAGFLARQGKGISFAHENIGDAARKWFTGLPMHALWLRENAVSKVLPVRFEDGFARGRIWAYLKEPQSAFRAFDAALGYSAEDFFRQFRCHKEIHRLLTQQDGSDEQERFFANFSRLSSSGQYVLSSEEQIELLEEALAYLDAMDAECTSDSRYGSLRCSLHHALSCQYLSRMSMSKYFEHARKALLVAGSLHDIAKMLNRLLMACTRNGDANTGLEVGCSALALATLIPQEQDPDLLSVNYGEFSFAVAPSYSELALWLAEAACANRRASRRQQAHDLYVRACALAQNGKIQDSCKALKNSWQIASASNMHSLLLGLKNCKGVLNGLEGHWGEAKSLFEQSLEEAAWLGCLSEALKAKQNLMISYTMAGYFSEAALLYVDLLRECREDVFTYHPKEGAKFLAEMRDKAELMLCRSHTGENMSLKLEELETQVRASLGKFCIRKGKNATRTTRNAIIVNASILYSINPVTFQDPQKFGFLKSNQNNAMRELPANAIQCTKNVLSLYLVC